MNKLLIKEFALKPRGLGNTFGLWGILYPYLLSFALFLSVPVISGPTFVGSRYISPLVFFVISAILVLLLIEIFFALFLTYRVFDSKTKSFITCIVQFVFSASVVFGNYIGLMMIIFRTTD